MENKVVITDQPKLFIWERTQIWLICADMQHILWLKLHRMRENAITTYASDSGPDLCRYRLTSGHNRAESIALSGRLTRLLLQRSITKVIWLQENTQIKCRFKVFLIFYNTND